MNQAHLSGENTKPDAKLTIRVPKLIFFGIQALMLAQIFANYFSVDGSHQSATLGLHLFVGAIFSAYLPNYLKLENDSFFQICDSVSPIVVAMPPRTFCLVPDIAHVVTLVATLFMNESAKLVTWALMIMLLIQWHPFVSVYWSAPEHYFPFSILISCVLWLVVFVDPIIAEQVFGLLFADATGGMRSLCVMYYSALFGVGFRRIVKTYINIRP